MVANMAKKMPNMNVAMVNKNRQNMRKTMTNAKIEKMARRNKTRTHM